MFNFLKKQKDPVIKALQDSFKSENRLFLLLDGRIHMTTSRNLDDIHFLSFAKTEQEAKDKGWEAHEKNPSCDAVWGEFILNPMNRKYNLCRLRYDMPPVLKFGNMFGG